MSPTMPPASDMSPEENDLLAHVLPYAEFLACESGADLISMGAPAESFYYVEKGTLEVSYSARQTDIVVALIGPGHFFGEIGFFDQLTRTRNIRAVDPIGMRIFDRPTMKRILSENPHLYARFMAYLLRTVCGRFRQVLSDRGPLIAYAAALSTGKDHFRGLQPLPADLLGSPEWRTISERMEEFKARMFDLGYRLQKDPAPGVSPEHRAEAENLLNTFFETIRQSAPLIAENESAALIWGYVFKEVFPYLMRSRFFERAYYKPKGYAGDFYMIEQIYRNQAEGDGKLGRLIDGILVNPFDFTHRRLVLVGRQSARNGHRAGGHIHRHGLRPLGAGRKFRCRQIDADRAPPALSEHLTQGLGGFAADRHLDVMKRAVKGTIGRTAVRVIRVMRRCVPSVAGQIQTAAKGNLVVDHHELLVMRSPQRMLVV